MEDVQTPESWVGLNVQTSIVQAAYSRQGPTFAPTSLTAHQRKGKLDAVNSMGMVASLYYDPEDPEEEAPVSTFYPWSSVLWLHPDPPTS